MGKNEIRLRRNRISAGRIAQHRNYGELMARHAHDVKLRRITKVVIYFLIIAFLMILFIIVARWENRKNIKEQETETAGNVITYNTSPQHETWDQWLQDDHKLIEKL
jgi:large-conductance mechanosensitive channel